MCIIFTNIDWILDLNLFPNVLKIFFLGLCLFLSVKIRLDVRVLRYALLEAQGNCFQKSSFFDTILLNAHCRVNILRSKYFVILA